MSISKVLSYLGGYFNTTEFELDVTKIADAAELSEDEVNEELKILHNNGEISLDDDKITLLTIKPKTNKKFNELYSPVETMKWDKNTMLKLDK